MIISIIGTNGLLANEIGLFCNKNNFTVISYGRKRPSIHEFHEFIILDLEKDVIDIDKLSESDVIIYASGAGIQSNVKDSFESIYNLNTYIPINICTKLNSLQYQGIFITFGSCFEIGNNSEPIQFSENEVASSMLNVPNDYCVSKRLLTRFVSSSTLSFKLIHFILPTIYGEKEAAHRLVPYMINSIKNKETMQFTSGKQIRQYLYAGDVPRIIFGLLPLVNHCIYNLSGVETYSVRDIVEQVCEFYHLQTNDDLFGKAERADAGMQNLQLDGDLVKTLLPDFNYTTFTETLKLYDQCL